jgi:hypothetical protein
MLTTADASCVASRPSRRMQPVMWKLSLAGVLVIVVGGCMHLGSFSPAMVSESLLLTGQRQGLFLRPRHAEIQAGQLVIRADFPLAPRHRLVRELEELQVDVSERLSLPVSDEPIELSLFESRERYDAFAASAFPGFPSRRAFFVKTDTSLSVYAHWQDRIAEDLRHETTHGYLHAVVPEVPLWLDEGIAEYFEVSRAHKRLHRGHVDRLAGRLLEGTWRPDLSRLEACVDAGLLTQDHYAEAWAWVHWMLETTTTRREMLQDYLVDLRRDPSSPPLSARLARSEGGLAAAGEELVRHLLALEESAGE